VGQHKGVVDWEDSTGSLNSARNRPVPQYETGNWKAMNSSSSSGFATSSRSQLVIGVDAVLPYHPRSPSTHDCFSECEGHGELAQNSGSFSGNLNHGLNIWEPFIYIKDMILVLSTRTIPPSGS
jgi:hypothetical protein